MLCLMPISPCPLGSGQSLAAVGTPGCPGEWKYQILHAVLPPPTPTPRLHPQLPG